MSKKEERSISLIEMLQIHKRLDVKSVASSLGISEATVRRLFSELEDRGKVLRVHGGVQLAPQIGFDYSYKLSTLHRSAEKIAIAKAAAALVASNERLFLDSGTTVVKLAECLSLKLQTGELQNIVVLTNSIGLIDTLANWCKVIIIGGEVRVERKDVCGVISEKSLAQFNVNKAFLGADGIMPDSGLMTTDERTARMAEIVLERAENTYVLADSEKFGKPSFITYSPFAGITQIITDIGLDESELKAYKAAGAKITVVNLS